MSGFWLIAVFVIGGTIYFKTHRLRVMFLLHVDIKCRGCASSDTPELARDTFR